MANHRYRVLARATNRTEKLPINSIQEASIDILINSKKSLLYVVKGDRLARGGVLAIGPLPSALQTLIFIL
jgi:hypothetical protein